MTTRREKAGFSGDNVALSGTWRPRWNGVVTDTASVAKKGAESRIGSFASFGSHTISTLVTSEIQRLSWSGSRSCSTMVHRRGCSILHIRYILPHSFAVEAADAESAVWALDGGWAMNR